MKFAIVKRASALAALATILGLFIAPIVGAADTFYGAFMRDSSYNLDVNCKAGCGLPPGSAVAIVDKTSASPAPVASVNDSVSGPALATYARNQLYNAGASNYDRQHECGWSASEQSGAACIASYSVDYVVASNVAATANQSWTQFMPNGGAPMPGGPKQIVLCMSASAATTFTVTQSLDRGTTYFGSSVDGTATSANYAPTGAGSLCERIGGANVVKVATSAAVTVSIQVQANW